LFTFAFTYSGKQMIAEASCAVFIVLTYENRLTGYIQKLTIKCKKGLNNNTCVSSNDTTYNYNLSHTNFSFIKHLL